MKTVCTNCLIEFDVSVGHFNRAKKIGAPLFCCKACFFEFRKVDKPVEQKKLEKKLYDAEYRVRKAAEIKEKKREYFKRTYDPKSAAVQRKERMQQHAEYCRRPEYKEYKRKYDEQHRAKKLFGEFFESVLLLKTIESEVEKLATKEEIRIINRVYNKAQFRRREYERSISNQP